MGFIMGSESRTATNVVGTNVKRAVTVSTGEWSPDGPDGCFSEYPSEYAMTSLKVYVDGTASACGSQPIRGVLYDPQGQLKATTQTVTIRAGRAAGWVTLPFATPVTGRDEGGVNYLLGVHTGGTSCVVRVFGASGEGGSLFNTDTFTDGPAATFGPASTGALSTAVYAYGGM